jgi:hypothetical protein
MNIRIKKQYLEGINRVEAFGEIKEILINQDFIEPKKVSVSLCFRGKGTAGIVDLVPEEFEMISKEINSRKKLLKKTKVLKFKN